jgi:hypothetical protein
MVDKNVLFYITENDFLNLDLSAPANSNAKTSVYEISMASAPLVPDNVTLPSPPINRFSYSDTN